MDNSLENIEQTDPVNQPETDARKPLKKPMSLLKKVFIGILGFFLLLLISLPFILNIYAERIFGEAVKQIVKRETGGKYVFTYQKIGFNLFLSDLTFLNLSISPDSTYQNTDSTVISNPQKLIELKIPELHFSGSGIYNVIRKKELVVNRFYIGRPGLKLYLNLPSHDTIKQVDTLSGRDRNQRLLNVYLKDYLTLLKIIDFELSDGSLEIIRGTTDSAQSIKLSDFSVLFTNLQVDSLTTQSLQNLLLSDSLGLTFKSGRFEFLGNQHSLTFNNISINTTGQSIEISGLEVRPDSSKMENNDKSWVEVSVPHLKLNGFNFQDFASKKLTVNEIVIIEPDILFHPTQNNPNKKFDHQILSQQIFEALSKLFYPIEVGKISIQSANFKIDGFESTTLKELNLADFSIDLQHFKMDSVSYSERSRLFFIDDFRLFLNHQEFLLKKSARLITFENLFLDTQTSELEMCDFSVEDLRKKPKTTSTNFRVPGIYLKGKNFKQDFLTNRFQILNLWFDRPDISIRVPDSMPESTKKFDTHLLYNEIKGFLTELSVDSLNISEANFSYGRFEEPFINQLSSPDVSVVVTDFLLNKNAGKNTEKLFYSSGIEINATGFAAIAPVLIGVGIHQLLFDQLRISTKDSSVIISGLHADTLKTPLHDSVFAANRDRVKFDVEQVLFKGIDFREFFDNQFVLIDTIEMIKPEGHFVDNLLDAGDTTTDAKQKNQLPDFQINHVKLKNGSFYLKEIPGNLARKIAVDGLTFSFDCLVPAPPGKKNKIEVENLDLSTESFTINLPEKGYAFEMAKLKISAADSLIKASNLLLQPLNPIQGNEKITVRAKIPGFSFKGIDLGDLYEKNNLRSAEVHFDKPSFRFILSKKTRDNEAVAINGEIIKNEILKIFGAVDIQKFSMTNADVEVFGGSTFSSRELLIGDFDLEIASFFVDSASSMTSKNLFFTDDIHFLARNEIKASVGDDFDLNFGKVSGSTKNGFIKAEGLILNGKELNKNKIQPQKITGIEVMLKNLDLKGIDFYKFVTSKKLDLERLSIHEPDIWITREIDTRIVKHSENKAFDFYSMISKQISEIQIADADITRATLKLTDKKDQTSATSLLNRINADFRNILIDSSNNAFDQKFFYSDLFNLSISDYTYLTPDSLYALGAKQLAFSSKNATLKIDSGYLSPQFDEETFAARVGHQTDRFSFVFDSARVNNINVPEMLFKNSVLISNVTVNQFVFDDYRNKSYEMLPDHYAGLPVSGLKKLPFLFKLDTLKVKNSRVQYREYVPPAFEPGIIWFEGLALEGRNITNDTAFIAANGKMNFIATARLMSEADVSFMVNFDLKSSDDAFFATGTLNKLELPSMNPFLENVAFVKVKKGTNNLLKFELNGNNDVARGELSFNYNKLSIRLIDKETMQDKGFGESVASFIANNFIVRSDNPKYTMLFRKGKIYFERNKQKSFFSFVAKSLLSGISSTIRGGNEERKEKRKEKQRKRNLDDQSRPEAMLNDNEKIMRKCFL